MLLSLSRCKQGQKRHNSNVFPVSTVPKDPRVIAPWCEAPHQGTGLEAQPALKVTTGIQGIWARAFPRSFHCTKFHSQCPNTYSALCPNVRMDSNSARHKHMLEKNCQNRALYATHISHAFIPHNCRLHPPPPPATSLTHATLSLTYNNFTHTNFTYNNFTHTHKLNIQYFPTQLHTHKLNI